ncbi:MAG: ATP-grasp domain-containing protein [Acutalibacteraceae bacterium]|nr:ATP-grasp domain-containing protein [Acutalibacteraceae bacterium]
MKKIIILGAGIYQVPLIKQAKKLGVYTIVVSIKGNYPGFKYADKVYYENTTDYNAILKIAEDENVDGIVTAGTDVAVITIGKVCDKLGLCGLSEKAATIASNKLLMKTEYEKYGVRTAGFRKVEFIEADIIKATTELNYPLIFKAVDTSGSRGIIKVEKPEEITSATEIVKSATKLDYFIIEEFITGVEFGAQAFVQDNKLQFCLPHGDYIFTGDTGVPVGHFAPYNLSDDIIADTKLQLTNAINAMGLNNCAVNADFILSDNKVYVLEIGGRSGATCLAELVSIYYDFNYYEKLILSALGQSPSFESSKKVPNASRLITSEKTGEIKLISNNNISNSNIVEIQLDYQVGDKIKKFNVGPDRVGHIITKGDTLDEAVNTLEKAINNIILEIE